MRREFTHNELIIGRELMTSPVYNRRSLTGVTLAVAGLATTAANLVDYFVAEIPHVSQEPFTIIASALGYSGLALVHSGRNRFFRSVDSYRNPNNTQSGAS